jgi:acyl-CoA reductase-like NAD-dependent aldehyde dehydrogenase
MLSERGLQSFGMYINGASVDASSGKFLESLNPYTGEPWATVPKGNKEDINAAVAAARVAFDQGQRGRMTAAQRAGDQPSSLWRGTRL